MLNGADVFLLTGYGVGVGGGGQFLGPESLKKSHMERIDVFDGLFDHLHLLWSKIENESISQRTEKQQNHKITRLTSSDLFLFRISKWYDKCQSISYLWDAWLGGDGRHHVLESEVFFLGHPSLVAHPARPPEGREAQHHPAVVVVVVVTVEWVVVVVADCCTLIPPALQQAQSPTLTDGGGSCRWHGSFTVGWLGARHFLNPNKSVECAFKKKITKIFFRPEFYAEKRRRHTVKEEDDANGTKARYQLTGNRFPAIGLALSAAGLASFSTACVVVPSFSALSLPPTSNAHSIGLDTPTHRFSFSEHFEMLYGISLYPHKHNSMNPSHSPHWTAVIFIGKLTLRIRSCLFVQ